MCKNRSCIHTDTHSDTHTHTHYRLAEEQLAIAWSRSRSIKNMQAGRSMQLQYIFSVFVQAGAVCSKWS